MNRGVAASIGVKRRSDGGDLASPASIAVAIAAAAVMGFELLRPWHFDSSPVAGAIGIGVAAGALVAATLLFMAFGQTRRLRDLLIVCALAAFSINAFVFFALPGLTGNHEVPASATHLVFSVTVALAFALAAFEPGMRLEGKRRKSVGFVGLCGAALVTLLAALAPLGVTAQLLSAALLLASGGAFLRRSSQGERDAGLLAAAAFVLGLARLQYLATPTMPIDWIMAADVLRVLGCGVLVAFAFRQHSRTRQEAIDAAVAAERQRIARDLHDGLAQDLAFIAFHERELDAELGPEHPVVVAARHALAASRGTISDLSASGAPNTSEALRQVAQQLGTRFRVQVDVRTDGEEGPSTVALRSSAEREEIVRIAREAIVNAIIHGGATQIDVQLERRRDSFRLRVSDNGCGIGETSLNSSQGFGLATIRARADALGGQLTARPGPGGGTELEVLVS